MTLACGDLFLSVLKENAPICRKNLRVFVSPWFDSTL